MRNMVKNRSLARAISDAAWADFRSFLEYKAVWYGREVIAVDRFFPSSKLCSVCGTLQDKMPLNVREWTCDCGTTHDRDVNAAKNILAGERVYDIWNVNEDAEYHEAGGSGVKEALASERLVPQKVRETAAA